MLFYIDRTVSEELAQRGMTEEECCFFGDLARACQRGDCFLSGDVDSLYCLSDNPEQPFRSFYRVIREKRAEHRAIMQAVSTVFVLTFAKKPSSKQLPSFLRENENWMFLCVSDCISNHFRLDVNCRLLTENLDDANFYEIIAERYRLQKGFHGIRLSFYEEHGGGDPICNVLEKCVASQKCLRYALLIAIVNTVKRKSTRANRKVEVHGLVYAKKRKILNRFLCCLPSPYIHFMSMR